MSSLSPEELAKLPFRSFWEKGYQDGGVSTMGGPNHDIVELAVRRLASSSVLDRLWSRAELSEEEAMELAIEEVSAVRSARQAG